MKRSYGLAWAVACAAITFAQAGGSAAAKSKPVSLPVVAGSGYLALGDSVSFGYMEPGVTPTPNYQDPANFLGYPEQVASALHLRVANAACPGETSSSLIGMYALSFACESNPAGTNAHYRFNFPLHVSYQGSQLAYALSYLKRRRKMRLVSLMIGANDFFYCRATTQDACASASEMAAVAATVTTNVHTILSAVRKKAHYRGQLVIVNYYSLSYADPTQVAQLQALNHIQDAAAKPFHVQIADGSGEFALGSAHAGGIPCAAGLLTQLGGGKCGIHPSYTGQALLAKAVVRAIKLG